jgi:predicted nucleic acid-binding protein
VIVYVDTSALGSAYLDDEADGEWIGELVLRGPDPAVTCELTDVELGSAFARAWRAGRIDEAGASARLEVYEAHTADGGPLGIVPVTHDTLLMARSFVLRTSIRTIDAVHLAAARILADGCKDEVVILTRDNRQGAAAAALGFTLHPRSAR